MTDNNQNEKVTTIIEAARIRFARFGFSKVTMDEIAEDVHMGKASLYYYFPTKESIFKEVVAQEQNELASEIETIISNEDSCSEKLIEYVKVRIHYFQTLVNLGMLSVHSLSKPKPMYKSLFIELEAKELLFVQRILEIGIKKGEFRDDLEKETPTVILHILQGLRFRVLKQSSEIDLNEQTILDLQNEMNIAINLILKGILK